MRPGVILGSPEKLKALADRLSRYDKVAALDEAEEPQGWSLAFTFSELERSFRRFLDEHLPRLTEEELSVDEMRNVLTDIGDEFRHILYHINDSRYYSYLPGSRWSSAEQD